ncbi:MAG TPA: isopentenyl-diphosphate Delta-isomerase [Anaerolineae bacterium]|nr:isopentenyl-diphosphate Delta-isomerase [Anaerolineae bacterium]
MEEQVILVDKEDREIGTEKKMATHRKGLLHRAFSVLIFNSAGEMLLQQRAATKYHSGGLWSNACCGHPRPGEPTAAAARRRLHEELGMDCPLEETFAFYYRAELEDGLSENEYDHVLVGQCDGLTPQPDSTEVSDWRWMDMAALRADIAAQPERYTYWFKVLLEHLAKQG